jgi:PLD-like domain
MTDDFQLLSDADLCALAEALRSARLGMPFSSAALQGYCPGNIAAKVAGRMQQLASEGMQPPHLAFLLETIVSTRSHKQRDLLDLVWTGPEVLGLVDRDTGVVVRQLFENARGQVLIAGYAVHQGREVFAGLARRMDELPGLVVRMFLDVPRRFGDVTPERELLAQFAAHFRKHEWPKGRLPELYHDPRSLALDAEKRSSLHAKCVVVDRESAFISSANFTEAAQIRNIEAGVLIRSPLFSSQLSDHFERLVERGLLVRLPL